MRRHQGEPLDVFVSYAHEDEELCAELRKHLKILERKGLIRSWDDRAIVPGEEWQGRIDDRLNAADVILLLVSPDFMVSHYCCDVELPRALQRHETEGTRVVPIILRPTEWQGEPFSRLQILPKGSTPVTSWGDRDEALLSVLQGLRAAIEDELEKRRRARAAERPRPEPEAKPKPKPPRRGAGSTLPERTATKDPPGGAEKPGRAPPSGHREEDDAGPLIWVRRHPLTVAIVAAAAVVAVAAIVLLGGGAEETTSPELGLIEVERGAYVNVTTPGQRPMRGDRLRIERAVDVYRRQEGGNPGERINRKIGGWGRGTVVDVIERYAGPAERGQGHWLRCRKTEEKAP